MISPQLNDLIGLGDGLRHIKELILGLLQLLTERETKRLQNQSLEIQNAGCILALCAKYGCSPTQLLLLINLAVSREATFPLINNNLQFGSTSDDCLPKN
jgi:hypothetical protein